MRILLDTTYSLLSPYSGTAVYTRMLSDELSRIDGVEVQQVHNRRRRRPAGGGAGSLRNLVTDRWWTSRELPRVARRIGADLIHHPLPAYARRTQTPQVVTVMDIAFERLPECFDRGFRVYARRTHRAAALSADAVVCISETTAADTRELWGLGSERTVVAPLGPGQPLPAPKAERTHFLYVGDDEPRKNLPTLLAAYARYRDLGDQPLKLVLAGSTTAAGDGIGLEPRPTAERLGELYAGAVALVHPSLYEGFGLTVLEAMAAGVPVIAANSRGVAEICGDAAVLVDPRGTGAWADAMLQMSLDPARRQHLAEAGRRRAGEFSWARCARAHLDAYSLALDRA